MCRSATYRVLDMVSEVGEVAKEILEMSDYGKKRITYRASLKMELGDLLYSLITVANAFNVDLEEAVEEALQKYKKRLRQGSAGSA